MTGKQECVKLFIVLSECQQSTICKTSTSRHHPFLHHLSVLSNAEEWISCINYTVLFCFVFPETDGRHSVKKMMTQWVFRCGRLNDIQISGIQRRLKCHKKQQGMEKVKTARLNVNKTGYWLAHTSWCWTKYTSCGFEESLIEGCELLFATYVGRKFIGCTFTDS